MSKSQVQVACPVLIFFLSITLQIDPSKCPYVLSSSNPHRPTIKLKKITKNSVKTNKNKAIQNQSQLNGILIDSNVVKGKNFKFYPKMYGLKEKIS